MEIPLNTALGGDELGEVGSQPLSIHLNHIPSFPPNLERLFPSYYRGLCHLNNSIPPSPLPSILGAAWSYPEDGKSNRCHLLAWLQDHVAAGLAVILLLSGREGSIMLPGLTLASCSRRNSD